MVEVRGPRGAQHRRVLPAALPRRLPAARRRRRGRRLRRPALRRRPRGPLPRREAHGEEPAHRGHRRLRRQPRRPQGRGRVRHDRRGRRTAFLPLDVRRHRLHQALGSPRGRRRPRAHRLAAHRGRPGHPAHRLPDRGRPAGPDRRQPGRLRLPRLRQHRHLVLPLVPRHRADERLLGHPPRPALPDHRGRHRLGGARSGPRHGAGPGHAGRLRRHPGGPAEPPYRQDPQTQAPEAESFSAAEKNGQEVSMDLEVSEVRR